MGGRGSEEARKFYGCGTCFVCFGVSRIFGEARAGAHPWRLELCEHLVQRRLRDRFPRFRDGEGRFAGRRSFAPLCASRRTIAVLGGFGKTESSGGVCENGGASKISDCGNEEIIITTIDEIIGNTKVGYIKMDIEGLEERALEGGRKTIRRDKPILAISIYHKRDDIWNIHLKILEIDPDYHFYLNHYSFSWDDTVLYAI